jgi:hypothetical protein
MMHCRIAREDLKGELPRLYSQQTEIDPIVYKRLVAPGSRWACYLAEASEKDDDLRLFGFFFGEIQTWNSISLSALEAAAQEAHLDIQIDREFRPMRFSCIRRDVR